MKSILNRVAQHTKQRSSPSKDTTRIFILANRAEIQKTLDAGYDRKDIWETLIKDKQIKCSYPRFCQKLKLYLTPQADTEQT